MGQLDASIVSLALPTLQEAFHASLDQVEWVALAYLLVLAATVVAVGRLADMVGRKLLYIYGFVVFTVASVACGLAPNLPTLDVFRAVQALGAAMLQANSVALIVTALPPGKLGRGIGVQGAAQAVGLALGPTVGGALIGIGGWRLIFLVNVPAGLIGILLGWFLLPRSRGLAPRVRFDWTGLALFAPAIGALLAALSLGSRGSFTSPAALGLATTAVGCSVAFVRWERRATAPMIDFELFRRMPFAAGIASGLLSYLVLFGVLFITPFFIESVLHASPTRTGLELAVLPVALGASALSTGRLSDRLGARIPTVVGMTLTAVGLALAALVHTGTVVLLSELAVVGVGLGAFTPANNAAIMASAARHQAGVAGGVLNMTRGVGTALGVAVSGLVFGLVAGHRSGLGPAGSTGRGFSAALLVLVGLSMGAALIAALPSRARPRQRAMARVA